MKAHSILNASIVTSHTHTYVHTDTRTNKHIGALDKTADSVLADVPALTAIYCTPSTLTSRLCLVNNILFYIPNRPTMRQES